MTSALDGVTSAMDNFTSMLSGTMLTGKTKNQADIEMRLEMFAMFPENSVCAECDERNPTWASILVPPASASSMFSSLTLEQLKLTTGTKNKWNRKDKQGKRILGVFICQKCSNFHIQMGRNVCEVKNLRVAEQWTEEEVSIMEQSGNQVTNLIYEASIKPHEKDTINSIPDIREQLDVRSEFVLAKYRDMAYFSEPNIKKYIQCRYYPTIYGSIAQFTNMARLENKNMANGSTSGAADQQSQPEAPAPPTPKRSSLIGPMLGPILGGSSAAAASEPKEARSAESSMEFSMNDTSTVEGSESHPLDESAENKLDASDGSVPKLTDMDEQQQQPEGGQEQSKSPKKENTADDGSSGEKDQQGLEFLARRSRPNRRSNRRAMISGSASASNTPDKTTRIRRPTSNPNLIPAHAGSDLTKRSSMPDLDKAASMHTRRNISGRRTSASQELDSKSAHASSTRRSTRGSLLAKENPDATTNEEGEAPPTTRKSDVAASMRRASKNRMRRSVSMVAAAEDMTSQGEETPTKSRKVKMRRSKSDDGDRLSLAASAHGLNKSRRQRRSTVAFTEADGDGDASAEKSPMHRRPSRRTLTGPGVNKRLSRRNLMAGAPESAGNKDEKDKAGVSPKPEDSMNRRKSRRNLTECNDQEGDNPKANRNNMSRQKSRRSVMREASPDSSESNDDIDVSIDEDDDFSPKRLDRRNYDRKSRRKLKTTEPEVEDDDERLGSISSNLSDQIKAMVHMVGAVSASKETAISSTTSRSESTITPPRQRRASVCTADTKQQVLRKSISPRRNSAPTVDADDKDAFKKTASSIMALAVQKSTNEAVRRLRAEGRGSFEDGGHGGRAERRGSAGHVGRAERRGSAGYGGRAERRGSGGHGAMSESTRHEARRLMSNAMTSCSRIGYVHDDDSKSKTSKFLALAAEKRSIVKASQEEQVDAASEVAAILTGGII